MNEPARSESLDARAWWTLAVVVAVVLIAYLGLSAGRMSSHDQAQTATRGAEAHSQTEVSATMDGSMGDPTSDPPVDDRAASPADDDSSGSEPLDAQSLRDFGELGVLPGLFDDLTSLPDCDFDDALSTCQ